MDEVDGYVVDVDEVAGYVEVDGYVELDGYVVEVDGYIV